MKKILLFAAVALLAISCSKTPKAVVNATIEGAPDSSVVLQKLNFNRLTVVDTIKTDASGSFKYKVELTGNAPYFYYLYLGEEPVASLVLLDGDKVTVNVDKFGLFTVEGSPESELVKSVNDKFEGVKYKMNRLLENMPGQPTAQQARAVNAQVSRLYVDFKRDMIKHVVTNPYSISSAVALFQKFNDNFPVFGDDTDAILFKRVQDSLMTVYPQSEYVLALRDEVEARAKYLELATRLKNVDEINFPSIEMPDIEGNMRSVGEFDGKVIILSFWSVGQEEHKMFNAEMIDMYRRLHPKGLEIYQVGLDIDKPSWAAAVKSQGLPWVNVNDGYGIESRAVSLFNITTVPAMYVVNRKGEVVARNVFDVAELEKIVSKCL